MFYLSTDFLFFVIITILAQLFGMTPKATTSTGENSAVRIPE
jgi:hypothetical protein